MLTQEQINIIVGKLNEKIDLPFIPESMEEGLFEIAIAAVANKLGDLLPAHWIPYLTDFTIGITGTDEQLAVLVSNIASKLNEKIDIPLVKEDRELELIEAITATIFDALREGSALVLD